MLLCRFDDIVLAKFRVGNRLQAQEGGAIVVLLRTYKVFTALVSTKAEALLWTFGIQHSASFMTTKKMKKARYLWKRVSIILKLAMSATIDLLSRLCS